MAGFGRRKPFFLTPRPLAIFRRMLLSSKVIWTAHQETIMPAEPQLATIERIRELRSFLADSTSAFAQRTAS